MLSRNYPGSRLSVPRLPGGHASIGALLYARRQRVSDDGVSLINIMGGIYMRQFAVLLILLCALPASAEDGLYVYGLAGQSRFGLTTPDGTWRQEGLGYHATRQAVAWGAGLGYGWSHVAIEAGYLDFGKPASGGYAVSDADYYPSTKSYNHQAQAVYFTAKDTMQAGQVKAKFFTDFYGFTPFITGGLWGGPHQVDVAINAQHIAFHGFLIGVSGGGGLCYKYVCGQVDYYKGISQTGYPISTEIVMPSVQVKIPLVWP